MESAPRPDLSVIIVNFNTRGLLLQVMRSLAENSPELTREVIVVDNASADGSADALAAAYPDAVLLRSERNLGFAGGNNLALRRARGRHVILLNTDIILHADALARMVRFLDSHPEAGVVGGKVLNADGTLQLSGKTFPDPKMAAWIGLGLHKVFPNASLTRRYYLPPESYNDMREVEHVMGCALMARGEAVGRVGGLDEQFFLYCEDVDWCRRIRDAGYKIYYLPEAVVTHLKGGTSSRFSPVMIRAYHQSAWRFYRKHYVARSSPFVNAFMWAGIWGRMWWHLLLNRVARDKRVRY